MLKECKSNEKFKTISTNLIDMYNLHAIIVVFFCKNLSRHRVYLHNWIKGLWYRQSKEQKRYRAKPARVYLHNWIKGLR